MSVGYAIPIDLYSLGIWLLSVGNGVYSLSDLHYPPHNKPPCDLLLVQNKTPVHKGLPPSTGSWCWLRSYMNTRTMNTKLTLTLEKEIIEEAKKYASKKGRSLSEMVGNYSKYIIEPNTQSATSEELSPRV